MREGIRNNENAGLGQNIQALEDTLRKLKNASEEEAEQIIMDFGTLLDQCKAQIENKQGGERTDEGENSLAPRETDEAAGETTDSGVIDLMPDLFGSTPEEDVLADASLKSAGDGLASSLNEFGRVDINYISRKTGLTKEEVIRDLKGVIFRNPARWDGRTETGWETADEYLSGNIVRKYRAAVEAEKTYPGLFTTNLAALKEFLPEAPETDEVYITLGSPWVPSDIIDDFICYISGTRPIIDKALAEYRKVRHDPLTGLWEIPYKNRFNYSAAAIRNTEAYGTRRKPMLYLLEDTLNMKTPRIMDSVYRNGVRVIGESVLNEKETLLAIEKQERLTEKFREWVWSDEKRKERLLEIYEDTYSALRKRNFNGSFLTFPGISDKVSLYPYQKNAVARILFTPNTLLAHDVGSGKTYIMIAAGMEMRRLGISKKNLYVVPNNLTGQWKGFFLEMYPDANLLIVEPKDFRKENRNKTLRTIMKNDYDGIIMAASVFDRLPLSERYYRNFYREQTEKLREARQVFYSGAPLDRRLRSIDKILEDIHAEMKKCDVKVFFDDLGITTLFVDEAHNYKNLAVETNIRGNHSISKTGSKKCGLMLDRVRAVQAANGGRGVVFATGTPITNSVTDIFVMQKYLQNGELTLLGLQNFDSWAGMFAEKTAAYEIDVDTNSYHMVERFASFHNLPELTSILSSIADFHQVGEENGIPKCDGYTNTVLEGSAYFRKFLKDISKRADDVRKHRVKREEDNLLKITTDGRKAALDMRLIDTAYPENPLGKVEACAENVMKVYKGTADRKLTQLVFLDYSTPKAGFNLYDELRKLLIAKGADPREIAFIHSFDTDKKREKLYKDVREGKVRILIGSTAKLGLGVNVQDKLIAIHHLDVPWRPSDMGQREGRILRQGNTNPEVFIFRYITKGSFDAYSWQLLETKQRFITELLSGSLTGRDGTDVDETVLSYAEIKALAVGNPAIKKRCELTNTLDRERILERGYNDMRARLAGEKAAIPDKIRSIREKIAFAEKDRETAIGNTRKYTPEENKALRDRITKLLNISFEKPEETYIGEYCGFRLSVPANLMREDPKLLLRGAGRYYIDIPKEGGIIARLNNFLGNFDKKIDEYNKAVLALTEREKAITEELAEDKSRADIIRKLEAELRKTEKEMGLTA